MSRTGNAIRNSAYGIAGKAVNLLFSFASRTVFIYHLGNTYLGINGLYTEVLSVLSFAELGIGSALVYAMYEPVAQGKELETVQLLDFYRTAYRIIACVIALIGLGIVPFLPYIVKGADLLTVRDLRLYYVIFLFNTVASYFVTYKYSFVNALQRNYIVTNFDTLVNAVTAVLQIVTILATKDFLAYLLTHSFCLAVSRVAAAVYLNDKFPILTKKPEAPLPREKRKGIFREVKALAAGQIASVAVHSTDNIIISSFTGPGVAAVGLVSNYMMLINNVLAFALILFGSVVSGFGNLVATSTKEHYRDAFLEANFIDFWIYGFCCIAFYILIPPFITLWIGEESLIDGTSFLLILINQFLQGQYTVYSYARSAKGHFDVDVIPVLIQPVVNLVVSIIGAKTLGLVGVYVGTVVSRLIIMTRPMFGYRFLFGRSPAEYYKRLFVYSAAVVLGGALTYAATYRLLAVVTLSNFILSVCITAVLPNLLFLLLFFRSHEFKKVLLRIEFTMGRGSADE